MKTIIHFFKSLWNFCFGKKKSKVRSRDKALEEMLCPKPKQTALFNKQQLPGKLMSSGRGYESRIGHLIERRICKANNKIKFKYPILEA